MALTEHTDLMPTEQLAQPVPARLDRPRVIAAAVFFIALAVIWVEATHMWSWLPLSALALVAGLYATGPWVADDPAPAPSRLDTWDGIR